MKLKQNGNGLNKPDELISRSDNKMKEAWRVIKSLTNRQSISKEDLIMNSEGKTITTPQKIAEIFNDYFTNSVEELVKEIINQDHNDSNNTYLIHYNKPIHL